MPDDQDERRATDLAEKAAKARRLAMAVNDNDAERLLDFARQLEEEAAGIVARLKAMRVNRAILRQSVAELRATSESAKRSLATAKELRARRAAKGAAKKDSP
jgi:hypothetical protein